MANHTGHHINTIYCACQAFILWKALFVPGFSETVGNLEFVFLKATMRIQCSQGPDKSLDLFLYYLLTGACK